jgi:hypothetical protein
MDCHDINDQFSTRIHVDWTIIGGDTYANAKMWQQRHNAAGKGLMKQYTSTHVPHAYYPLQASTPTRFFFNSCTRLTSSPPNKPRIDPGLAASIPPLRTKSKGAQYIPLKDPARVIVWYPILADPAHHAGAVPIPLPKKEFFFTSPDCATRSDPVATIGRPRELRAALLAQQIGLSVKI